MYVSTTLDVCLRVFEVCFDRSRSMFRPCSTTIPIIHVFVSTVLEVCFEIAQGMVRSCSRYIYIYIYIDWARGILRSCSRSVSIALKVIFDRDRGAF